MSITIIIVDDHQVFRNGLSLALTAAGMKVVAMVGDGNPLIETAKQLLPNVVIIDICMPHSWQLFSVLGYTHGTNGNVSTDPVYYFRKEK